MSSQDLKNKTKTLSESLAPTGSATAATLASGPRSSCPSAQAPIRIADFVIPRKEFVSQLVEANKSRIMVPKGNLSIWRRVRKENQEPVAPVKPKISEVLKNKAPVPASRSVKKLVPQIPAQKKVSRPLTGKPGPSMSFRSSKSTNALASNSKLASASNTAPTIPRKQIRGILKPQKSSQDVVKSERARCSVSWADIDDDKLNQNYSTDDVDDEMCLRICREQRVRKALDIAVFGLTCKTGEIIRIQRVLELETELAEAKEDLENYRQAFGLVPLRQVEQTSEIQNCDNNWMVPDSMDKIDNLDSIWPNTMENDADDVDWDNWLADAEKFSDEREPSQTTPLDNQPEQNPPMEKIPDLNALRAKYQSSFEHGLNYVRSATFPPRPNLDPIKEDDGEWADDQGKDMGGAGEAEREDRSKNDAEI